MVNKQNFSKRFLILLTIGLLFLALISFVIAAPKTFTVKETDLVKITPSAIDPDNDQIVYYYSSPLDKNGQWQTGYDDAGVYDLEIIASDGLDRSVEKVRLIVENKNLPPIVTEKKFTIKETQTINLKDFIEDPDQDALAYTFSEPLDKNGIWQPGYEDEGSFIINIVVNDGEFKVKERIELEVLNTNQPPKILDSFSEQTVFNTVEDEDLEFSVQVEDYDGDEITYRWIFDNNLIVGEKSSGEYYLDYETKGQHTLTLIISDGLTEKTKEWTIAVENNNRKPVLIVLPVTINEGEKLSLDLPDLDLDGDVLSYSFETPLDENGEWVPDFDAAGTHKLDITASDGELTTQETVKIIVLDVDQAPVLNLPDKLEVSEAEELFYQIESYDPDGDKIVMSVGGFPEGTFDGLEGVSKASFNNLEGILMFEPNYDFIKRKGGLISNLLNSLRLEHLFLGKQVLPLNITSCGKEKCTSKTTKLVVYNVNRAPQLNQLTGMTISETELAQFSAQAVDPDGDIVRYYFSEPLNKNGGDWQTNYDSEGEYPVIITATDGHIGDTQTTTLKVKKTNREPSLIIKNDDLVVNEGEELSFTVTATDPDNDELNIRLDNLPLGASFSEGNFVWTPDHDQVKERSTSFWDNLVSSFSFSNRRYNSEEKIVWLSFVVTDETFEIVHPVKITIKNVNREPEIRDYLPLQSLDSTKLIVPTDKSIIFQAITQDLDGDKLEYEWDFGLMKGGVKGTDTITRTFLVPGKKTVQVTINDGRDSVQKSWDIEVVAPGGNTPIESDLPVVEFDSPVEEKPFSIGIYVVDG